MSLNLYELQQVLTTYDDGMLSYIVTDYLKVNYGQPILRLAREQDGNIYAFVDTEDSSTCLCKIESKEHLVKLKESLLGVVSQSKSSTRKDGENERRR